MAVPLDEAGHRELAAEVDHFGARADVPLDLGVRAERDDAAAAGGERLHFRRRLERDDLAVVEHEIGRCDALRLRDERRRAGERRDDDGE